MTCLGCRKAASVTNPDDYPFGEEDVDYELPVEVPPTPLSFSLVGTVTPAAAQSTAWGRSIQGMTVLDGDIFMGYGDWVSNTGPITIWMYNPFSDTLASTGFSTYNECVWHMHNLNGVLWVPYIDPKGNNGMLAKYDGNTWTEIDTGIGMYHVFDVVDFGPHIYACGSYRTGGTPVDEGVVIRSADNGDTWSIFQRFPAFTRVNFLQRHGSELFFTGSNGREYSYSTSWTESLTPRIPIISPHNNHILGSDTIVYSTNYPSDCMDVTVVAGATGLSSMRALGRGLNEAYAISATKIYRITDAGFTDVYSHDIPPSSCPSSICADDGYIYVGTSDSKFYKSELVV